MTDYARIAFEAAPVGMVLSENRVIRVCNRMFCQLTGFDYDELVGHSFRVLYESDAEFDRVRDVGLGALGAGEDYSDMRLLRHRDGSSVWCRFRAQTLTPSDPLLRTVLTYAKVAETSLHPVLSPRERDVVLGLREGKTSKRIAADLGLSRRTVEDVRARLLKKFQSRNALEMLRKFTNVEL